MLWRLVVNIEVHNIYNIRQREYDVSIMQSKVKPQSLDDLDPVAKVNLLNYVLIGEQDGPLRANWLAHV